MALSESLRFRLDASTDLPQDTIRIKGDGSAPVAPTAPPTTSPPAANPAGVQTPAAPAASGTEVCVQQAPFLLLFGVVLYFFILRPAQKQEKVRRELLAKVKRGDKVVTSSGMHGVITSITDDSVQLKVDADVTLTFDRTAIAKVVVDEGAKTEPKKP